MHSQAELDSTLQRNFDRVRAAAAAAALRAGRKPESVRLVAVTKTVPANIVARLFQLGAQALGENRIQDAAPIIEEIGPGPEWHLIGHLQSNKVRRAVALFDWIHSIDSAALLERVAAVAAELGRRPRVLLQVNVSGEESKHGMTELEAEQLAAKALSRTDVAVAGLMTMAPLGREPEASRPHFRRLRELSERIAASNPGAVEFRELSMGMTNDFAVAIEEGATLIRVGRALFDGIEEGRA